MYADPLLAVDHVGAKAYPDEKRNKRHDRRCDRYHENGRKPIEAGLPGADIWPLAAEWLCLHAMGRGYQNRLQ
jgi:hypothetical protein